MENYVVHNKYFDILDADDVFAIETWAEFKKNGPYPRIETYQLIPDTVTIYDLLVKEGIFSSKSQARKNWKGPEIQDGWNEFKSLGKFKRHIYVYKPFYFDPYAYSD